MKHSVSHLTKCRYLLSDDMNHALQFIDYLETQEQLRKMPMPPYTVSYGSLISVLCLPP